MRRSGKKRPVRTHVSPETRAPLSVAVSSEGLKPVRKNLALAPREGMSIPRTTIDDPWRDLHPARIWPD
jgi:hypothetical protein